MKIYLVIWEDRHTDVEVYPYLSKAAALAFAATESQKMLDRYGCDEDSTLTDLMIQAGWIFYCCYTSEGDTIRVVEKVLDD